MTEDDLARARCEPYAVDWDVKTSIAYALATGAHPGDGGRYVYEAAGPVVLPSFASALSVRWLPVLHGLAPSWAPLILAAQDWELADQPLTPAGRGRASWSIDSLQPAGRNAAVTVRARLENGAGLIARTATTLMSRRTVAAGEAFGATCDRVAIEVPEQPPAVTVELATSPQLTALFRLTLPLDPTRRPSDVLHIDAEAARAAGFAAPPLHGPAVEGILLRHVLEHDPAAAHRAVVGMRTQFRRPVVSGDRLTIRVWPDAQGTVVAADTHAGPAALARVAWGDAAGADGADVVERPAVNRA
jgi:hypothetical protein